MHGTEIHIHLRPESVDSGGLCHEHGSQAGFAFGRGRLWLADQSDRPLCERCAPVDLRAGRATLAERDRLTELLPQLVPGDAALVRSLIAAEDAAVVEQSRAFLAGARAVVQRGGPELEELRNLLVDVLPAPAAAAPAAPAEPEPIEAVSRRLGWRLGGFGG